MNWTWVNFKTDDKDHRDQKYTLKQCSLTEEGQWLVLVTVNMRMHQLENQKIIEITLFWKDDLQKFATVPLITGYCKIRAFSYSSNFVFYSFLHNKQLQAL